MIREGVAADVPRIRAIQHAALAEPWPELLDVAVDGPQIFLVVEADRPIGYALVVPADPVAYVAEFAIEPTQQRSGYGTRLMQSLLDRLTSEGFETVRLTVRADDDRARSFYETCGFVGIDRIGDHYERGDGVLMERTL